MEWNQLINTFSYSSVFTDTTHPDRIIWRWKSTGQFYVHSLYTWLDYGGMKDKVYTTLWKTKIPLKIKIFMWLVKEGKILTKDNLAKKGWSGNMTCQFCNLVETIDHLFVTCPVISAIWNWISLHNNFAFNCDQLSDL